MAMMRQHFGLKAWLIAALIWLAAFKLFERFWEKGLGDLVEPVERGGLVALAVHFVLVALPFVLLVDLVDRLIEPLPARLAAYVIIMGIVAAILVGSALAESGCMS